MPASAGGSTSSAAPAGQSTKGFTKYKIVIVGDMMVGKTAVIGRYVYGVFNDSYQSTIGIDFLAKSIKYEGRNVRLQLWDTAGQERFRSLIPSYLRDASAVIVMYDITSRESFNSTSKWITDVREDQGFKAPMMLVGNKVDLADSRAVQTYQGEEAAEAAGMMFVEVSAKDGTNIEEMIQKLVAGLPVQAGGGGGEGNHGQERQGLKLKAPDKDAGKQQQCQC
mmetsp:Transcript_29/g.81  ORF Transcript_29/g.81 Transcript_29/m.81 type:complete len:223 (-) Transcript_29:167-835(-)